MSFWKSSNQPGLQQFHQLIIKNSFWVYGSKDLFSIFDVTTHIRSCHVSVIDCCVTKHSKTWWLKTATVFFVHSSMGWLGLCWAVLPFVSFGVSHEVAVRWLCSHARCPSVGWLGVGVTSCSFSFHVAPCASFHGDEILKVSTSIQISPGAQALLSLVCIILANVLCTGQAYSQQGEAICKSMSIGSHGSLGSTAALAYRVWQIQEKAKRMHI